MRQNRVEIGADDGDGGRRDAGNRWAWPSVSGRVSENRWTISLESPAPGRRESLGDPPALAVLSPGNGLFLAHR